MGSRRAMSRWGWRLVRREWRQQSLVIGLVSLSIAITSFVVTAGTNAIEPIHHYGSATQEITLFVGNHTPAQLKQILTDALDHPEIFSQRTRIRQQGSTETFDISDSPVHTKFGGEPFRLVAGTLPVTRNEAAVTRSLLSSFNSGVGGSITIGDNTYRVVGRLEDPSALNRRHVLVARGEVGSPTEVRALIGASSDPTNPFNRRIRERMAIQNLGSQSNRRIFTTLAISVLASIAMVEIGLLCATGFAVIARRRIRQFGMLSAIGAHERQIRQAMALNGLAVGIVGGTLGVALGFGASLTLQGAIEEMIGARIGFWGIPWSMMVPFVGLAAVTTTIAAWWPARTISRLSITESLASRRPQARTVRCTAALGLVFAIIGSITFGWAVAHEVTAVAAISIVVAIAGILLLAPAAVSRIGRVSARLPLPLRIAGRDLARHQSRSAVAIAALTIALGIPLALTIGGTSSDATLRKRLPNLPNNIARIRYIYAPDIPPNDFDPASMATEFDPASVRKELAAMAEAIPGSRVVEVLAAIDPAAPDDEIMLRTGPVKRRPLLRVTRVNPSQPGSVFQIPVWVATPELLAAWSLDPTLARSTSAVLGEPLAGLAVTSGMAPSIRKANISVTPLGLLPYSETARYWIPQRWVQEHKFETKIIDWTLVAPDSITKGQRALLFNEAGDHLAVSTTRALQSSEGLRRTSLLIGSAIALAILAFIVALIRSDAIEEQQVLMAVGAPRQMRRTIAGATAIMLSGTAGLLAVPVGYLSLVAMMSNRNAKQGFVLPLGVLALVCVGFPILAGAGAWLLTGKTADFSRRRVL